MMKATDLGYGMAGDYKKKEPASLKLSRSNCLYSHIFPLSDPNPISVFLYRCPTIENMSFHGLTLQISDPSTSVVIHTTPKVKKIFLSFKCILDFVDIPSSRVKKAVKTFYPPPVNFVSMVKIALCQLLWVLRQRRSL